MCYAVGPALLERYKYYVVINNGMRGPFAHAKQGHEQQHWTQPFIQKLDSHVCALLMHVFVAIMHCPLLLCIKPTICTIHCRHEDRK